MNRRVTVMGLGRHGGGVAAARYLAERGARVTVSDCADEASLRDSAAELRDVPIAAFHFGGHDPADFRSAEYLVVNPAVRPGNASRQLALHSGARLTSEIELFLSACPARVIGVTGSNGKSTTCAMLADILRAAGRRTLLGGNIGRSLLGELDSLTAADWVVLELSSFQLAHLSDAARLPEIAVITNCTANHLDWHGTFADYARAKQRLVAGSPRGIVVLNRHDAEVSSWRRIAAGDARFGWPLDRVGRLSVPGEHNRHNAACAAAAAEAAGVEQETIVSALASYAGLPHRLQPLGQIAKRRFYNDSKSTTPEATIAALSAIEGPVWLLAGGDSKGADFDVLAQQIVARARGAAIFGRDGDRLATCLQRCGPEFSLHGAREMSEALDWCWRQSCVGDAILLSPACASHDQFRDFVQRGEKFSALVRALAERHQPDALARA